MAVDIQAQKVLNDMLEAGIPPRELLSPAQARMYSRLRPLEPGPEAAKVEDKLVPGQDGLLTVRFYTPFGVGPFPVLVWLHGGGWVEGDLDKADGTARQLSKRIGCIVASVDYRLAPETKFPGPVEDCYIATQWISRNAQNLNVDPEKIAIGGDSAGGNLAAAVCIMARDRGGFSLIFQLLVYPVTDHNFDTTSYQSCADGYGLTRNSMMWFWAHYLKDKKDAKNSYAAPLQSEDLANLPAALVITAEYDPLCDEGKAYADALKTAGVNTDYNCYQGMIHGFFGMASKLDKAKQALDDAANILKQVFAEEN